MPNQAFFFIDIFFQFGNFSISILLQTNSFVIQNIKFVIVRGEKNIKFLAFNIKFLVVRAHFPRIMRAREDRHNSRCLRQR